MPKSHKIKTSAYSLLTAKTGEEGLEPPSTVLETAALPLNYSPIVGCFLPTSNNSFIISQFHVHVNNFWVFRIDFCRNIRPYKHLKAAYAKSARWLPAHCVPRKAQSRPPASFSPYRPGVKCSFQTPVLPPHVPAVPQGKPHGLPRTGPLRRK